MSLLDNLISFWELEEASGTRNDAHGTNHLTDNNTVTQVTGKVGSCAHFDVASSEYLSHSSNSSLQMGDIAFTICAWVKLDSNQTGQIVAKDSDAANSRDYTIQTIDEGGSSKVRWYITGGAGPSFVDGTTLLSTNTWYFLVAWHDPIADTVTLQINNGTPDIATTAGIAPDVSSTEFRIGARVYATVEGYFNGLIDQVGIWKRLLTSDERSQLYNSGNGLSYTAMGGGIVVTLPQLERGIRGLNRGLRSFA